MGAEGQGGRGSTSCGLHGSHSPKHTWQVARGKGPEGFRAAWGRVYMMEKVGDSVGNSK